MLPWTVAPVKLYPFVNRVSRCAKLAGWKQSLQQHKLVDSSKRCCHAMAHSFAKAC